MINKASRHIVDAVHLEFPITLLYEMCIRDRDYSYHGRGVGCEARTAVTPDTRKGYLISEFEGAQFPAKPCLLYTSRCV